MRNFKARAEEVQQLASAPLTTLDIFSKDRVDSGLITFPVLSKESQNVWIKAQRNLFLFAWPAYGRCKKIGAKLWDFGVVNFFIFQSINAFPIRPGVLSRIACAHYDWPSLLK